MRFSVFTNSISIHASNEGQINQEKELPSTSIQSEGNIKGY